MRSTTLTVSGLAALHSFRAAAFRGGPTGGTRRGPAVRGRGSAPPGLGAARDFGSAVRELFNPTGTPRAPASPASEDERAVRSFLAAVNARRPPRDLLPYFAEDVRFVDTAYYSPIAGRAALLRHFHLHAGSSALSTFVRDAPADVEIAIDDLVASTDDGGASRVCVRYHLAATGDGAGDLPDTAALSFYTLEAGEITRVFDATEPPSPKPGDGGLELLRTVSQLIGDESLVAKANADSGDDAAASSSVERYFEAWNRRDMPGATALFAPDCVMRDLQYDDAFHGRDEFEQHLLRVKDCLPGAFDFVVDDVAASATKVGVAWHVENAGAPLAFTRGASFYTLDPRSGLIRTGFEIPEKAPPKGGYWRTLAARFEAEPVRYVPAAVWAAYMYVLFFSDGILPGANALALEQRTWEEVRDLSLNFFLVSPILDLPFSPVVHPMLEGVFNLLLAWAALFAGFLSDERREKPNLLPFGPMLVGMQFLTSGFLLPYLFTRTPERSLGSEEGVIYREDIDGDLQAAVAEWRPLGGLLGGVGTASVAWGLFARPEFGDFGARYQSFGELLGIDRVGSSFLVDLVIFAAFQGWFVDDDLRRRGVGEGDLAPLRNAAKYLPFFGLVAYLTLRPALPASRG